MDLDTPCIIRTYIQGTRVSFGIKSLTCTSKPLKQPICLRLPNESGYGHEICTSRLRVTFYGKKHTTLFKDHQLVTQEWLVMDLKGNQLTCYLYDLSSKNGP
jgi:hypothetical protein